jgi:hypothetical protein
MMRDITSRRRCFPAERHCQRRSPRVAGEENQHRLNEPLLLLLVNELSRQDPRAEWLFPPFGDAPLTAPPSTYAKAAAAALTTAADPGVTSTSPALACTAKPLICGCCGPKCVDLVLSSKRLPAPGAAQSADADPAPSSA